MEIYVEGIINEIKKGRTYTIACSRYEEYIWYEDGKFWKGEEDGGPSNYLREISEEIARRDISIALHNPNDYDACFDFE